MSSREPRLRVRRTKTATESLLSIVLSLEAILVFFIVLVAYGLKVVPAGIAFGGGAALFIALLLDGRWVRYSWGIWVGWVLQVGLIVLGLLIPVMYVVGLVFLGFWIYCFVTGRRLDKRKAEYLAAHPS